VDKLTSSHGGRIRGRRATVNVLRDGKM